MKRIGFFILFLAIFAYGCLDLTTETQPEGILTGKVTIGPLCPAEPCDLTEEQIQAAYDARRILVYDKDTTIVLWKAGISSDSSYTVSLTQGSYIVDINYISDDHSGDVPAKVNILPGDTVVLDIDIDTGIR